MINDILEILSSKEIIIVTILLVILLSAFLINISFQKRYKNKSKNTKKVKKEMTDIDKKSGKIIVADSTYELLMKDKKDRDNYGLVKKEKQI